MKLLLAVLVVCAGCCPHDAPPTTQIVREKYICGEASRMILISENGARVEVKEDEFDTTRVGSKYRGKWTGGQFAEDLIPQRKNE